MRKVAEGELTPAERETLEMRDSGMGLRAICDARDVTYGFTKRLLASARKKRAAKAGAV